MALPKWAETALNTQESEIEKLKLKIKGLTTELKQAVDIIDELRDQVASLKQEAAVLSQ